MTTEAIAIIGAGKVGTALGSLLRRAGYTVAAVADISAEAVEAALPYTGGRACDDPAEAARNGDSVFITTVDDAILSVCRSIAQQGALGPGKRVIHMSGAGGLDLLEPARATGAGIASIHPLQSFADRDGGIRAIPGSTFAVTAGDGMRDWALHIVTDLGGIPFFVADEDKPLYHAAACVASNYLISLMTVAVSLFEKAGIPRDATLRSIMPLVRGTVENLERKGAEAALTGPIARGDVTTVKKHLRVLAARSPEFLCLYREMGRVACNVARKNGTISARQAEQLAALLKGGHDHE